MSKSKRRIQQAEADQVPDVLPMPAVAEAAVHVEAPTVPVGEQIDETATDALPAMPEAAYATDTGILLEPAEVDRGMRVSCGKVIARKLSMPPAAAQELAALLHDTQVVQILQLQLETEPAARIRQILGLAN